MLSEPDFSYRRSRDLGKWLRRTGPAIVLPNWVWSAYDVVGVLRQRGMVLPTVAYCRSDSEAHYYSLLRRHLAEIDWIVAVSNECHAGVLERFPTHQDFAVCIPTFVARQPQLDRVYMPTGEVRLMYTGRFETEDKRVLDLLLLAGHLLDRGVNFSLTFVGSGSRTTDLLTAMARLNHFGRIRLVGQVHPTQMPCLLAQADVFVQASETEGLSNSMLEAMAAGVVPVVTQASSGIDGIVHDGVSGFVVPVGAMEEMADRIADLASNNSRLCEMGAAAHAATEDFTWERYVGRLEPFLRRVESRALLGDQAK